MKKFLFCLLMLSSLTMADSLDFMQRDKQYHYVAGVLSGAFVQAFVPDDASPLSRLIISTVAASILGGLKEVYDRNPDANDMAATVLGGFSVGLIYTFTN